jgi:predicted O-methyltransferase YrrM
MSYLGYIKPISALLSHIDNPSILEIGVDYGQSALPLIHNLCLNDDFMYQGIDIKIRGEFLEQALQMHNVFIHGVNSPGDEKTNVILYHGNSLRVLPDLRDAEFKFDLILIDGDHNYFTVSRELEIIKDMIYPSTIVICDDYNTRWAEKDLYYGEKDTYANNPLATKRQETESVGVKNAILDFLKDNPGWSLQSYAGDPCFLFYNEHINFSLDMSNCNTTISNAQPMINFKTRESLGRFKKEMHETLMG